MPSDKEQAQGWEAGTGEAELGSLCRSPYFPVEAAGSAYSSVQHKSFSWKMLLAQWPDK